MNYIKSWSFSLRKRIQHNWKLFYMSWLCNQWGAFPIYRLYLLDEDNFSFQFMCSDIRSIFHHHHDFYDMKGSEKRRKSRLADREHYFALLTSINFINLTLCHNWNFPFSIHPPSLEEIRKFPLQKCHKTVCRSYSSIMNDDYQIMAWLPIENLIKKFLYCFSLK